MTEKRAERESIFTKHLHFIVLFAVSLATVASAQTVTQQIDVPGTPMGIAVNALTNHVYVSQNNTDEESAATFISNIDGATNAVLNMVPGPGDVLGNVAVDVVTGRVYVVGCTTLQVAEISCVIGVYDSSLNGIATISDVALGSPLAVNPITHRLYYARDSVSGMAVLDTRTNTYLGTIKLEDSSPVGLDIDLSTNHVFAAYGSNQVALIDAHTSKVLRTTSVGTENTDVAVDPFRHYLYVADGNGQSTARSTVAVLNTDTLALQKKILVGANPSRIAIDTFSGRVFVTNNRYSTLYVIDEETQQVQKKLTGPRGPVEVNPNTKFVYTGTLTIYIDPITGKVDVISE